MWLDDCRIPTSENLNGGGYGGNNIGTAVYALSDGRKTLPTNKLSKDDYEQPQGRFTPNLLVCDDMLNDGVITKQSKRTYKPTEHSGSLFGNSPQAHGVGIGDSGSSSRYYDLDKWFDKIIDEIQ
jgi:hypothetical protein